MPRILSKLGAACRRAFQALIDFLQLSAEIGPLGWLVEYGGFLIFLAIVPLMAVFSSSVREEMMDRLNYNPRRGTVELLGCALILTLQIAVLSWSAIHFIRWLRSTPEHNAKKPPLLEHSGSQVTLPKESDR